MVLPTNSFVRGNVMVKRALYIVTSSLAPSYLAPATASTGVVNRSPRGTAPTLAPLTAPHGRQGARASAPPTRLRPSA